MKYYTLDDIKRINREKGYYYFSPDTMRFFKSRVSEDVYQGEGGVFLVTSEQGPNMPRLYSVRQFFPETGKVNTVDEFQAYKTLSAAKRRAEFCAKYGINDNQRMRGV